ncbi:MAG: AbrB/MazE/SpoVT family DNA-binding domain-containing protein [Oscillospiraceae bacterium]|nr:AbrB/MazE/SpoVT family DNA-binding domain-containing protein [Oscillospiraceae bacterium]
MKATGIVRRIDDLGRVVIPKEIRRTMRIREGDPLEIYTTREGEVIFKKYSLIGGLEDFAAQFCDTLSRSTDFTAAVTDRDAIIAVAGSGKRELMGKQISAALESMMEQRSIYRCADTPHIPVSDSADKHTVAVAAPILCGGDVLGLVLFLTADGKQGGETEYKLAQTVAAFLGRHMEG